MRIRDEITLGVGTLLLVQILMIIAAVGLLSRMTPALDQVLQDNERSIHAVERMLIVLAEPVSAERDADRRQRFEQALADAQANITEERETEVLAAIEASADVGLAGDPSAMAELRADLGKLGDINRDAMHQADLRAKRLGNAGAWILVLLGLISLGLSIAVIRRFQDKLIRPVYQLGSVLEACRAGDRHRRFSPIDASLEFHEVGVVVNSLVSEHFERIDRDWEAVAKLDRTAVLWLLDRVKDPSFVCDREGGILAANQAGLDALGRPADADLRERISRGCRGETIARLRVEPLRDVGWVCTLTAS